MTQRQFLVLQGSVNGVPASEMQRIRSEADRLRSEVIGQYLRRIGNTIHNAFSARGCDYRTAPAAH